MPGVYANRELLAQIGFLFPILQGMDIYKNQSIRNKQFFRILGKIITIASATFRHRIGRAYNEPGPNLSYTENFLYMLDHLNESDFRCNPTLVKAIDVASILF